MVRWRDEMNDWQYWHENFFVVNFGYLYPTLEDYVKYKKRYNKWRVRHIAAFGVTDLDPQTKQEILINGWKK